MDDNLIKSLEISIAKDIEYILTYKPRAINAKAAPHFSKMTIIKPIALNVYPQIYVDLVRRFEENEAIRRLKSMGLRVARYYYSSFPDILKKTQKFTEIFSEVAKSHLHSKLLFKNKIMEDKQLKSCTIEVKNCFFCTEIALFEDIEIPYCTPFVGLYENLYNIKSLYNKNLEPRLIRIVAVRSAKDENDTCEYQLTVID